MGNQRNFIMRSWFKVIMMLLATGKVQAQEADAGGGGFGFERVRSLASARAAKPYMERKSNLAQFWKTLPGKDFDTITFEQDKALWREQKLGYALEFLHPGPANSYPMALAEIIDGAPQEIMWQSSLYNYRGIKLPAEVDHPENYAGVKIVIPVDDSKSLGPVAIFDSACQLRCTAPHLQFGLSALGIAINPGSAENEEFPRFERIWMERPIVGSKAMNFYALLDGRSVVGAYRFRLIPGRSTVLEVEAEITLRKPVTRLGLAPLASMFWFSEFTQPHPLDYRPEVHQSDGLLIHISAGEAQWHPLDNGNAMRFSKIPLDKFIGFGLIQRDREFKSYQDLGAHFHLRPSAYVEPVGSWPAGSVQLIELPTKDSHDDNVTAYWEPTKHPKPGQPLKIGYRIHWLGEMGVGGLSKVVSSRRTQSIFDPSEKRTASTRYYVDFAQLSNPQDEAGEVVLAVEVGNGGKLKEKSMQRNPNTGGWRAEFLVTNPDDAAQCEMNCRLIAAGRPVSETWTYLWKK